MALLSTSGWILKIIHPHKGGMQNKGMRSIASEIMGLERCEWRDIHMWAGIIILVLILLHIMLHWNIIITFFNKNIPNSTTRFILYVLLFILSAISILPWIYVIAF